MKGRPNNQLEEMWKKVGLAVLKPDPYIYLWWLRKVTKEINQNSQVSDLD
jgi:hypothetical protein